MNITEDILYIGVNDHETDLFEGQYRIPNGMAYNSYVVMDEKIAVLDTVDAKFTQPWLDALQAALKGRAPDYLVVQHMEPDHSAGIARFAAAYPGALIVGNARTFAMIEGFFDGLDLAGRKLVVEDGGTLPLGAHTLTFLFAPMVHWPEAMVSYESKERILFSADAFGKFGALDIEEDWVSEARRYYFGIVGKYGAPVRALLKKAAALDIRRICPLHGPMLSQNLDSYLRLYDIWSSYGVESAGVMIAYTSVYGNTRKAVALLADALEQKGCPKVVVCDLARADMSKAVENAFRYGKLILATTTYNGDIFPFMRQFIEQLTERGYQGRTVGLMENGSWAPVAARLMQGMLSASKNLTWLTTTVRIKSALKQENLCQIEAMAGELA